MARIYQVDTPNATVVAYDTRQRGTAMVRKQLRLKRQENLARGLRSVTEQLAPDMEVAIVAANKAYAALGVRYALVGALASGAQGRPRNTDDIDFLVGDEAFDRSGIIISFKLGMPLQAGEHAIDPIPLPVEEVRHRLLDAAMNEPLVDTTLGVPVPILPATALAFMKLASPRAKDLGDVVEMIQAGTVNLRELAVAVELDADRRMVERLKSALAEVEDND